MDHKIFPWELALLLTWLTAPAQSVMVAVLSALISIRGAFARPFRLRSVLVLVAAYTFALALTVPLWVLLPQFLLPASTLPDRWPSLPPLAFAPAWISCFVVGVAAWFVLRVWLGTSPLNPPLEPTARSNDG